MPTAEWSNAISKASAAPSSFRDLSSDDCARSALQCAWLEVRLAGTYWPLQGPYRGDVNPRLPLGCGTAMQWAIGTTSNTGFHEVVTSA